MYHEFVGFFVLISRWPRMFLTFEAVSSMKIKFWNYLFMWMVPRVMANVIRCLFLPTVTMVWSFLSCLFNRMVVCLEVLLSLATPQHPALSKQVDQRTRTYSREPILHQPISTALLIMWYLNTIDHLTKQG